MFEFFRENVLCGASDGCAPERDRRPFPQDRRPGEVISSQGGPSDALPFFESHIRGSTPIRSRPQQRQLPPGSPLMGRSPRPTRRTLTKSFSQDLREALGESFPASGAAVQEDALPGRGLCVNMQRGLGLRTPMGPDGRSFQESSGGGGSVSVGAGLIAQSVKPTPIGAKVGAADYRAHVEDPLDRSFEGILKQLNAGAARAMLVRKFAPNEYEVDGQRVTAGWRRLDSGSREAYVFDQTGPTESLNAFCARLAEAAMGRRHQQQPRPGGYVRTSPAGVPQPVHGGSFYSRDAGSFYASGSSGGSFYTAGLQSPGPQDPRLQAMKMAGTLGPTPHPLSVSRPAPSAASRVGSPVMKSSQARPYLMNSPQPHFQVVRQGGA